MFERYPPLSLEIDDHLRARFRAACGVTRECEENVVLACIKAYVEAVERDGEITHPLTFANGQRCCFEPFDANMPEVLREVLNPPPEKIKAHPMPTQIPKSTNLHGKKI